MSNERGRLKISIRAVNGKYLDHDEPREEFWRVVKAKEQWSQTSIDVLEQKLISRLGPELQSVLLDPITRRLSRIRYELFGRDFERYLEYPKERYYPGDVSGILESRDARLFSIPEYQQLMRRALLGSSLTFGVEIRGYASLELALVVNRLDALVDFLDADASLLAPLLAPFVATAFAEVFDRGLDQEVSVTVSPPSTIPPPPSGAGQKTADTQDIPTRTHSSSFVSRTEPTTRAQWLWLVANSSLLIPVLLTLFVAYQAVNELRSLRAQDSELIRPLLQHQLELLKEGREREKLLLDTTLQAIGQGVQTGATQHGVSVGQP